MGNVGRLYRPGGRAAPHRAGGRALLALGLTLAALLARADGGCEDRGARSPEARCESMPFGGRERHYRLYVPAHRAPRPALLVVLHGGGGGGASMEALTGHGFKRRADQEGALIAYPDGVGRGWNDGRHDLAAEATAEDVDDVGFLRALVARLAERYAVDPARVAVTGMSNGGMMTLRLACEARDVFHGFVAVAASLGADLAPRCEAPDLDRLALIDGTDDPIVPWEGGEVRVLWMHRGSVIGAPATFARLRALVGCAGEAVGAPLDRIDDDGTAVVLHRATGCARDLRLYEVRGGGHAWPGGARYARPWLIGRVSRELDATDEVWRFLGLGSGTPRGPV